MSALAEERRKRGLPEYARRRSRSKPKPKPKPVLRSDGLRTCGDCGEEWPLSEFTFAGSAFSDHGRKPCNACYTERYGRRVWRPCAACGRKVGTRKPEGRPAYHRACRPRPT